MRKVQPVRDETHPSELLLVLQVRPKGAGPWSWSHTTGTGSTPGVPVEFDWATVSVEIPPRKSRNGIRVTGYSIGHFAACAIPWSRVEEVVDAWFDAHDDEAWPWEFRLVTP
jgi:hypothetical protein